MELLKKKLQDFFNENNQSVNIYFRLKNGDMRIVDIEDIGTASICHLYKNFFNQNILEKENIELYKFSQADNRTEVVYEFDFSTNIAPFNSINFIDNDNEIDKFNLVEDKFECIDGVIAKIHNSHKNIICYSKFYSVSLLKQGKVIRLFNFNNRFKLFSEQMIQLNGKVDIFLFDKKYYLLKHEVLEKFYDFEDLIKNQVKVEFKKIEKLNILDDYDFLMNYLNKRLTLMRKFVRVLNYSKVFENNISKRSILSFIKKHDHIRSVIKIKDDETISLQTQKSCDYFLKTLDDVFLNSDLTNQEYEVLAKNIV